MCHHCHLILSLLYIRHTCLGLEFRQSLTLAGRLLSVPAAAQSIAGVNAVPAVHIGPIASGPDRLPPGTILLPRGKPCLPGAV